MRTYPFAAVVSSDDMALALALCAVSPAIGGVLVRGEKGTAKSTMVRALAALLPAVDVIPGCRFSCDPADPDPTGPDVARHGPPPVDGAATQHRPARLVELPVGATEDRVLGSLHLERALSAGVTEYEPGLLAAAHRGLLYVDEVNLLHDHLVDLLLDAAAMGRSTVERDGVSVAHAARFVLVGTMNPEEGELRPQLLDRFGLALRGWNQGWSVGVFQFVKSAKWRIGEQTAFETLATLHAQSGIGGPIEWHKMGAGWSWSRRAGGTETDHAAEAAQGWAEIKRRLATETHGLYVLDEFTYPINWGWVDIDDVVSTLASCPGRQHVVVTGRRADPKLLEIADLVTEMTKVKHPMDAGQKGQRGIE